MFKIIQRETVASERVSESFKNLDKGDTEKDRGVVGQVRTRETLNIWRETEKAYD